jgi:succinate dehydrogenase / fumarate reductase, membrane anchor subunit
VDAVKQMLTPLKRVRYLGAAHGGTEDFWRVRITGAGIFVLAIVFAAVLVAAIGRPYEGVVALIGSPLIAAVFALLIAITAVHMRIGMKEIIEDYVHGERLKILVSVANTFFCAAIGVAGVVAVLKLAVGVH